MIQDQGTAQDNGLMKPDLICLEEMINPIILICSNQPTYKPVMMIQDQDQALIRVINPLIQDLIPIQTFTGQDLVHQTEETNALMRDLFPTQTLTEQDLLHRTEVTKPEARII